uniref:Protein starmaker-like isoform X2 n=1 Tax=Crassostrea virginica TaxID=6565 RepID=A0A8B8B9Y3_CRAVI|nr:protein starmaker-like isoform X2 [Crassostrea virginica]
MASLKVNRIVWILVCLLVEWAVPQNVDFDGGDCSREFTVSQYDVYYLKADPNPLTSGGAASCTVRFRTSSAFNIYVQSVHVQDCTAKLFFYDNDNTQKYPSETLTCIPTVEAGGTFQTRTGNLIVRLEKGSGSTKAYSFSVILTTIEGQSVSNQVTDTAGGGVGTGAIVGIAVGVVAFLIIIIVVVCFFVCRQMAQQKEEKMRQQPSIFATASSRLATPSSASRPNTSGSQQFNRPASIRRHPRSPRLPISQGFDNRAFSETSNASTDFVESKVSYAIMSDGSIDGKSSIRPQNSQKRLRNGTVGRDRSAADKGLSDDARSSVKFDLRSESEMANKSNPIVGNYRREQNTTSKLATVRNTHNKENLQQTGARQPETSTRQPETTADKPKPKPSTTEGRNYFREYTNKGYEGDLQRAASLRKSGKSRETSSSSHNSSNSNRHLDERPRGHQGTDNRPRRSRSRSESRRDNERYRESESDDYYREHRQRSRSADRSHRRPRKRDDYYDDLESDSDYRDGHRRSRSTDRRSYRSPDRRSDSKHRSRNDYYDDYRSDDSFIRSSRRNDSHSGYRSDNRFDTRGSYRGDKRDGYRSDNRYDNRGGHRSDNRYDREGYKSDNRYDHRERAGSYRDRERRNRSAPRDRSDSHRSRTTSVGSSYSRGARSTSRYDRY